MSSTSKLHKVRIFSDGASRGNPGPSAIAFVILNLDGKLLERRSRFIGIGTNNQAEYKALISALRAASDLTDQEVECHLDSELVVRQLNGEYKIRNPVLKGLLFEVDSLKQRFRNVSFSYVPRTNSYIRRVDEMANKAIDTVRNRPEIGG